VRADVVGTCRFGQPANLTIGPDPGACLQSDQITHKSRSWGEFRTLLAPRHHAGCRCAPKPGQGSDLARLAFAFLTKTDQRRLIRVTNSRSPALSGGRRDQGH